ncbi:MAG: nuclear transport factor 2 family protein [Opitutaceae bacterium]|nr:nuclear transport factor 2 family protein [Cephaloticoccus sp.]MCP5530216.1 nuclear transport factor 2 family protein [Opitutaceae bacterium]
MTLRIISVILFSLSPCIAAASSAKADEAVLAAEHARARASLEADQATLRDLLSDDLLYVHSNGRQQHKADVLADVGDTPGLYEKFALSDLRPREVAQGVVIVNGRIDQTKIKHRQPQPLQLLFQSVWRNENGTWRMIALQTVLPPPAK